MDKDTLLYKEITKENGDKKILKSKGPKCHLKLREMDTSSKYLTESYQTLVQLVFNLAEDVAAFLEVYNSVNTIKGSSGG